MARRRKRVHRDWPAVIAAQRASGLSALAYCREQGICSSVFYRRRKQHQARTEGAGLSGFVELHAESSASAGSGVAVVRDGGWRIELSRQFDAETLQRALACVPFESPCWR
jgi:hypothetical protein